MEFTPYSSDMEFTDIGHPVFDCDFHFYETGDSFTRYLPKEYSGLLRLANVDGRTKMIVRGRVSDYIPNPTFEVVAAPGSGFEYFSGRNSQGKSFREIVKPMRAIPEFTEPRRKDGAARPNAHPGDRELPHPCLDDRGQLHG